MIERLAILLEILTILIVIERSYFRFMIERLTIRSVFKESWFNLIVLPDPGALNSCMHAFPETNDGLITV